MFKALATENRFRVSVSSKTFGSATFSDHVYTYDTLSTIQSKNFSVVVLQEQSNFLARGDYFAEQKVWPFASILAQEIAKSGARLVFYETMAYPTGLFYGETYEDMQAQVVYGYEGVRSRFSSETSHVGTSFQLAKISLQNDQEWLKLYSDNVHPSVRGTFLAACNFYAAILKKSPIGIKVPKSLRNKVTRAFIPKAQQWAAKANGFAE